jgi:DNA-binding response OmpR family regulator
MLPSPPVLIVEDDPEVREALRRLLSDEGYEVTTAAEGQEGLERLHASPRPWCVVLDLMLPNMDGFEFRVRQMGDPEVAAIPVIVLSAGGDVERKVAHLGVTASLTKPPDFDRLLACVAGCRSRN